MSEGAEIVFVTTDGCSSLSLVLPDNLFLSKECSSSPPSPSKNCEFVEIFLHF